MNKWQLHEAKNKLSNIIEVAMQGTPQCITKRGEEAVVIIGMKDYLKLKKGKLAFNQFLLGGTKSDDLEIVRSHGYVREYEL